MRYENILLLFFIIWFFIIIILIKNAHFLQYEEILSPRNGGFAQFKFVLDRQLRKPFRTVQKNQKSKTTKKIATYRHDILHYIMIKQPPTTSNSLQKPSPTSKNRQQTSKTIFNKHQQDSTILSNLQKPSIIFNNHQQPPATSNNIPQASITSDQQLSTRFHEL